MVLSRRCGRLVRRCGAGDGDLIHMELVPICKVPPQSTVTTDCMTSFAQHPVMEPAEVRSLLTFSTKDSQRNLWRRMALAFDSSMDLGPFLGNYCNESKETPKSTKINKKNLGGGFRYFLFSSQLGEMIQFD